MMQPVYEIHRLKKKYGEKQVLDLEDFEIFQGEVLGIAGKNGSGKSTLLRLLAYLEVPNGGEVCYRGFSNPSLSYRREIAMMFSEPCLLKRSVKENLIFGLKVRGEKYSEKQVFEVLDLVGLEPKKFIDRFYTELSSGEMQRVVFASRIIFSPKVLLLDEPTNSLDSDGLPKFSKAIEYVCQNFDTTIVIASHDKEWLKGIVSREIFLYSGQIIDPKNTFFFDGYWQRDEEENLFYDFGDGQILSVDKTICIAKNKRLGLSISKIFYEENKDALYGKIIAIEKMQDQIVLSIQIANEKIKTTMMQEEYFQAKITIGQKIWIMFDIQYLQSHPSLQLIIKD
ncbi:ATP-binding cassette domain-containing protein [Helicobacter sp. 13S00477-4]|uniref:ABC transporter ATP-binding protein n=1 Tax=Helicobacter sp. 13S00477-4 TaxID=1905759 RepID=UPI000BA53AE1|nr:ATP-binding cassette domain-containing protein [Helicobacter sp. 13S00477-4]PAF52085.1 hypothetical protein BKH44_04235 [Helicobacter sp. 13S00477-4]